jgi:hypothetical protein
MTRLWMRRSLRSRQLRRKENNNDEPEIRMITPPPVIITQESGRVFEFVLGRMEVPPKEGDEVSEVPPTSQTKTNEPEPEKVFVNYPFDQASGELTSLYESNEGVVLIEGLQFALNDKFTAGKYDIFVRDVTQSVKTVQTEIKIVLEIINPDEPQIPVKGKKK